ncbi:hypothetical protein CLOP_g2936 [Closterium sp. NIES-67]|nr:hypothetical protein CLOP_g2936 [Closterium sp. NIES-67]
MPGNFLSAISHSACLTSFYDQGFSSSTPSSTLSLLPSPPIQVSGRSRSVLPSNATLKCCVATFRMSFCAMTVLPP